ncbi:MAG: flagellar hook-length control protein FliK [Spirochaetes bacterium]|nr:flagellar hook-length control protein FliK [Spirochaetota bacterium]
MKAQEIVQESQITIQENKSKKPCKTEEEFDSVMDKKLQGEDKIPSSQKTKEKDKDKEKVSLKRSDQDEKGKGNKIEEKEENKLTEMLELKKQIISLLGFLKDKNEAVFNKFVKDFIKEKSHLDQQGKVIEKISIMNYKKLLELLSLLKKEMVKSPAILKKAPDLIRKEEEGTAKAIFLKRAAREKIVRKTGMPKKDFDPGQSGSKKDTFKPMQTFSFHRPLIIQKGTLALKETPPLLQKVRLNDIVDQIVQKVKVNILEGKSEVALTLKPEFLGKVFIKFQIEGNRFSGKIMVDNYFTHKLFIENYNQLKVSFQDMGLSVENFDIGMNNSGKFGFAEDRSVPVKGPALIKDIDDSHVIEEISSTLLSGYEGWDWLANNINLIV